MIYDRYGQFTFRESDERRRVAVQRVAAAEPCPEPVPREDTHGPPSPVPNTRVRSRRDRAQDSEELVLTPDALRYYDESYEARRQLREEVLEGEGECDFELGTALRLTWVSQQRGDTSLISIISTEPIPNGSHPRFRRISPHSRRPSLLRRVVRSPPEVTRRCSRR